MIKPQYKISDVRAFIQAKIQHNIRAMIETYKFVGEQFVREARIKTSEEGGFRDVTGNLRSSIGYIVLKDGVRIGELFEAGSGGTDNQTGVTKGKDFAKEVAANFPQGIVLIVVAGMEYAASVESRGKDVITGSSLNVESRLKNLLRAIR